jgi:predicted transcriptional regulator
MAQVGELTGLAQAQVDAFLNQRRPGLERAESAKIKPERIL